MSEMTWQEKFAKLNELCPTTVMRRYDGSCYVDAKCRETKEVRSCILSGTYGEGSSIEEAIEDDWRKIAGLPRGSVVVLNATSGDRRHVRWDGEKWVDDTLEVRQVYP